MKSLFRPEKIKACLYAPPKAKHLGMWRKLEPILSRIVPVFGAFVVVRACVEK
jgi:hypothetical protein